MALSADQQVIHRSPESILELGVSGSTTLYAGGVLVAVTDGNGNNTLIANAGTGNAAGVAVEGVDNSSGNSSDKTCKFLGPGAEVALPYSGTIVMGDVLYASDDQTVGNGEDGPRVGTALEFHESLANTVWVRIDPTA